jgi:hypothetical protein
MKAADRNLELLRVVAEHLGPLRDRVVFVGGAAAGLLITDPGAPTPRPTKDVDIIVEVASLAEYNTALRDQLLDLGFAEDGEEGAPRCRGATPATLGAACPAAIGGTPNGRGPARRERGRIAGEDWDKVHGCRKGCACWEPQLCPRMGDTELLDRCGARRRPGGNTAAMTVRGKSRLRLPTHPDDPRVGGLRRTALRDSRPGSWRRSPCCCTGGRCCRSS